MFSVFQFIAILFVFNSVSIHRKKFYANKTYIVIASCLLFICVCQISLNSFRKIFFGNILCNLVRYFYLKKLLSYFLNKINK